MSRRGKNLPEFIDRQLEFASHIRNPDAYPRPGDVEPRRMQIYLDLFYNNIESFLANTFPVAKKILGHERWHELARAFVHQHSSDSPYFLEISQEFLTFLADHQPAGLPPFLLELCHYEWVELALSVAEEEIPGAGIDPAGDLLDGTPVVSPLIWKLAYAFPVHKIGLEFQPRTPGEQPTQLVVYRRRDDSIGFMAVNALTMALLDELDGSVTGRQALQRLTARGADIDPEIINREGLATLERLRNAEILIGTRNETGDSS